MDEQAYLNRLQELWQKNWPEHLRIDPVYPLGEILITEYLQQWAAKQPDKPCLIYYGRTITFKEMDDFGIPPSGKIHTLRPLSNFFPASINAAYESLKLLLFTIIELFL